MINSNTAKETVYLKSGSGGPPHLVTIVGKRVTLTREWNEQPIRFRDNVPEIDFELEILCNMVVEGLESGVNVTHVQSFIDISPLHEAYYNEFASNKHIFGHIFERSSDVARNDWPRFCSVLLTDRKYELNFVNGSGDGYEYQEQQKKFQEDGGLTLAQLVEKDLMLTEATIGGVKDLHKSKVARENIGGKVNTAIQKDDMFNSKRKFHRQYYKNLENKVVIPLLKKYPSNTNA